MRGMVVLIYSHWTCLNLNIKGRKEEHEYLSNS